MAIARVLTARAEMIILDERTSTLADTEVDTLFRIIKRLNQRGKTIIYISHRLDEIFEIADRVTILKDGILVKTCDVEDITKEELINKMVGRILSRTFPQKRKEPSKDVLIHIENLTVKNNIYNISMDIMEGEILGIGGLVGMGQTALLNAIFGNTEISGGYIEYNGRKINK